MPRLSGMGEARGARTTRLLSEMHSTITGMSLETKSCITDVGLLGPLPDPYRVSVTSSHGETCSSLRESASLKLAILVYNL